MLALIALYALGPARKVPAGDAEQARVAGLSEHDDLRDPADLRPGRNAAQAPRPPARDPLQQPNGDVPTCRHWRS